MTLQEALAQLEAFGNEKMRAHNRKHGARDNQFGVKMGDIRTVAKKIKSDHALALELWDTDNIEARLLATLVISPKKLSHDDLHRMVTSERFVQVADWLYAYVIKPYPDTEPLRQAWMQSADGMAARAGWSLTSGCVVRNPGILDLPALLDRIEAEMPGAAPEVQWTMNSTLAQIGIHFPEHRSRALAIGEKLGIYRDYPVSKGCTSPFAPIWINEMVRRQG
ncbi:MAG: DNA alkylation repair protein [Bacteroidetes bacterium]|nr:DNA alkylation repair protein [Bacteroidota bacterium]